MYEILELVATERLRFQKEQGRLLAKFKRAKSSVDYASEHDDEYMLEEGQSLNAEYLEECAKNWEESLRAYTRIIARFYGKIDNGTLNKLKKIAKYSWRMQQSRLCMISNLEEQEQWQ